MCQAELLLLALLGRFGDQVAAGMQKDFLYMLQLLPRLLEELMKVRPINDKKGGGGGGGETRDFFSETEQNPEMKTPKR